MHGKVPDINDPAQWGPKIPSADHTFKKGDIFILDVWNNGTDRGVYRAEADWDPSMRRDLPLSRIYSDGSGWDDGHSWTMSDSRTVIREWYGAGKPIAKSNVASNQTSEKVDLSDWRAWQHNRPGECPCGIPRSRCEYH